MRTDHLASLGAREIPRAQFAARLAELTAAPAIEGWSDISRAWFPVGYGSLEVTEDA